MTTHPTAHCNSLNHDSVAIRESILNGNIFVARQLLDNHFPTVLNATKYTSQTPLPPRAFIPAEDAQFTALNPTTYSMGAERAQEPAYSCPVSLDHRHLSLNLRIQEFVEGLRTVPLTRTRLAASFYHGFVSSTTFGANPASYSPSTRALSPPPPPNIPKLLNEGQELWCLVSDLPSDSDRVLYMDELQNVGALIAYQVPETSPVAKYMSMQRREAVAEQINCAILCELPFPFSM